MTMKPSRSGLKFTCVGVKQEIVVGSLLRSKGYGSRIVRVLGFWTGVCPQGDDKYRFLVLTHHANTSWVWVESPHYGGVYRHWRDRKGGRHVTPINNIFINYGGGWEVVKEVK